MMPKYPPCWLWPGSGGESAVSTGKAEFLPLNNLGVKCWIKNYHHIFIRRIYLRMTNYLLNCFARIKRARTTLRLMPSDLAA